MSVCVCARVCFLLLLNSYSALLKVGFYIMKWNVIYKCVCVCVELLFCLSLRHRTKFYIGTLLILTACVCARSCRCEYVCLGVVLLVQMDC